MQRQKAWQKCRAFLLIFSDIFRLQTNRHLNEANICSRIPVIIFAMRNVW